MFIQQLYNKCLSQASYYIECHGEAAIIDPMRDVEDYLKLAEERKAKIKFVFETHFHADFVSGHLELAKKTNAVVVFGPEAKTKYHSFVANDNEEFCLGKSIIRVLHTPGHTIESACYLAINENGKAQFVFTGDTLFIGDVGRPDLMSGNLPKEVLAEKLYDSIQNKLFTLPDDVVVYPGHGAGSACGKITSNETSSTIGIQKKMNSALQGEGKESFIKYVTSDQPFSPAYFFKDARINAQGYDLLEKILKRSLVPLSPEELIKERDNGAVVLDTRKADDFTVQHIKGSLNIGLGGDLCHWVGTLIKFNAPLVLVCYPGTEKETVTRLARIGYENVKGYLEEPFLHWTLAKHKLNSSKTCTLDEAKRIYHSEDYILIDVRNYNEARVEKIKGSINIPLHQFSEIVDHLDKKANYIVYCAAGYRSMIASSILQNKGFTNIINIQGGIAYVKETQPSVIERVEE